VTFRRLAAIALIVIGTSIAWIVLGSPLIARTGQFDGRLEQEVQLSWDAVFRAGTSGQEWEGSHANRG
jgi:hypothetical protein